MSKEILSDAGDEKCRYKYSYKEDTINPILPHLKPLACIDDIHDRRESTGYKIKRYADVEGKRAGCLEEGK